MKIKEIIAYTDEIAPFESAEEWDNVGLLVGDENTEIGRVLLTLDITSEIVKEAQELDANLIISHHPVIFSPLCVLRPNDAAYLLAKYDIAALCLHTNLDRAKQGVNVALGNALGLKNTVFYPEDFLLIGEPDSTYTADEYATIIKERLGAPSVRYTDGTVTRVAVSSGGGSECVELAEKYGFDAFITGEMKHHHYLYATSHGIAAFDAGHFSTEDVIITPLKELLAKRFPKIDFIISRVSTCPYRAV